MDFESSAHLAERLGINVRTVQLWAKNGKLPGAYKMGRDWMIPRSVSDYLGLSPELAQMCEPLPLMNSTFEPGKAKEYIDSIDSEDVRLMALAEYYYFTGESKKACETIEKFISQCNGTINASAWAVYCFANMSLGRARIAKVACSSMCYTMQEILDKEVPDFVQSVCVFLMKTSRAITLNKCDDLSLKEYIKNLTGGLRTFSCFTLAQEACFNGQFGRACGIAEMGLALKDGNYPIAEIHLELVSAIAHLGLKETSKASVHLLKAWELAIKDGVIQPFIEHYSSIQMILRECVEDSYPEEYKKVSDAAKEFSSSRRRMSRNDEYDEVSKPLTITELAVSVLHNADVQNGDIARSLNITVTNVKEIIVTVYKKLGINNKKEMTRIFER